MYTFNKPSKNMNISDVEVMRAIREQQDALCDEEAERKHLLEHQEELEREEYAKNLLNYQLEHTVTRDQSLGIKKALFSECLYKLYEDSCILPMTNNTSKIARNLVSRFLNENDISSLLIKSRTKNVVLSEMSRLVDKYYGRVLEKCSKQESDDMTKGPKEFNIDSEDKDDFLDELKDVDTDDASRLIKDRVSDSITEFLDANAEQKSEYEDIINDAKDRMETAKEESYIDYYSNNAKRIINEKRMAREKNVFNCMVESLAKKSMTEDAFKAKYLNEATLDMDSIVHDTTLVYTMLEMVNTVGLIDVNEEYIDEYVKSLKA